MRIYIFLASACIFLFHNFSYGDVNFVNSLPLISILHQMFWEKATYQVINQFLESLTALENDCHGFSSTGSLKFSREKEMAC